MVNLPAKQYRAHRGKGKRMAEVVKLKASGLSNKQISEAMGISLSAVSNQLKKASRLESREPEESSEPRLVETGEVESGEPTCLVESSEVVESGEPLTGEPESSEPESSEVVDETELWAQHQDWPDDGPVDPYAGESYVHPDFVDVVAPAAGPEPIAEPIAEQEDEWPGPAMGSAWARVKGTLPAFCDTTGEELMGVEPFIVIDEAAPGTSSTQDPVLASMMSRFLGRAA